MRESSDYLPTSTLSKFAQLADLLQQASYLAREISQKQPGLNLMLPELKRPTHIPKDQEYFWTDKWQAEEREVDEQLARGEFEDYSNVEDAIAALHRHV